jgi:hypothetical protein
MEAIYEINKSQPVVVEFYINGLSTYKDIAEKCELNNYLG